MGRSASRECLYPGVSTSGGSASMVGGRRADPAAIGYYRIRSTRGLYAFYWRVFLLSLSLMNSNNLKHQKEACCEIQQIRLVD